jgi:hypothetical protein
MVIGFGEGGGMEWYCVRHWIVKESLGLYAFPPLVKNNELNNFFFFIVDEATARKLKLILNARKFGGDHCLHGVLINHTRTAAGGKVVVSLFSITKIPHVSCKNHKTWNINEDQGGFVMI